MVSQPETMVWRPVLVVITVPNCWAHEQSVCIFRYISFDTFVALTLFRHLPKVFYLTNTLDKFGDQLIAMEEHIMSRPHWKKKSIQRSNSVIDSSNSSNDLKFDDKSINKSETEDNDSVESEGKEATDGNEIKLKVNGKSGTRNPMCTRCANHIRTPVPVKGRPHFNLSLYRI